MARTENDIYESLEARLRSNEVLSQILTDERDVAIYNQILHIVSGEIAILEQNNDLHNLTVQDQANNQIVGSLPWHGWVCVNIFQNGDTLVFDKETGQYKYNVQNDDLKIVDLASAESESSKVIIKTLKLDSEGNGEPLTAQEKTSLEAFWSKYIFNGVQYSIVSQEGDEVYLSATIEVNKDIIGTDGISQSDSESKPVEEAIKSFYTGYQTDNDFNSIFYIRSLEDAIQAVEGVINVVVNTCQIKPLGGSYEDVKATSLQKYTPAAGWLKEDSLNPLSDNLTYV